MSRLSGERVREYTRRLLLSRMRVLCDHGFFGMLLMHMKLSLDERTETAYTDGRRIAFSPLFLDALSDEELDFILMHEVMHAVLKHIKRGKGLDRELFNIACDIVVNSNIMKEMGGDPASISLAEYGESVHLTPDGKEGYEFSAEQVYDMILLNMPGGNGGDKKDKSGSAGGDGKGKGKEKGGEGKSGSSGSDGKGKEKGSAKDTSGSAEGDGNSDIWDDHSRWGKSGEDESMLNAEWSRNLLQAYEAMKKRKSAGNIPAFAERLVKEYFSPQTDWRRILAEFVQEEINDYSFSPPDRRFQDSPFFLPDYNEKDDSVENILFMADTSGSMTDKMIAVSMSEIKGAIEQFDGKLQGLLGFFDAGITEPVPFESVTDLQAIIPRGGGGTDFHIIFKYIFENMTDRLPACIIILTDGYAGFPPESMARGIPVLWLINNEDVEPPWGKVARIKTDDQRG